MSRYLLDTNIISNVTRLTPSEALLAWMGEQADDDLFVASLTVAEIRRGRFVGVSHVHLAEDRSSE